MFLFSALAIERRVTCAKLNKSPHINDVYYEYIANDDCETVFVSPSDLIFPTSTSNMNFQSKAVTARDVETQVPKDTSLRKPRSEQTDEIMPTKMLKMESSVATTEVSATEAAEERQNNPNADIQDIITGIVKLLNGNVNVHANTQHMPPTTIRRFATRINNRGPPRIPDYPIVPIDEKYGNMKTTPYPSGIRKPPVIPYPFDMLPPEKPLRNEHPMLMHNNKPIPPNRLPWHGSRTRPPIQISNTNRLQMPTRLPQQTTLEFLPASKTVNPMVTFSTRTPNTTKSQEFVQSESQSSNLFDQMKTNNHNEQIAIEMSMESGFTEKIPKFPSSSLIPIIESSKEITELHMDTQSSTAKPTATIEKIITTMDSSTTPPHSSNTIDKTTKTPEPIETAQTTKNAVLQDSKSIEAVAISSSSSEISPSRVTEPSDRIESTNFKSFYARPGIVLDDTDFKPGQLEPSTQYNHVHQHGNTDIQSTATFSDIFAEIFDVTLSAIQGQPNSHHKVVDLLEIANTQRLANPELIATKYSGNDIIVTASDDNSFVSIDGKRTYINLFGETTETEQLKPPTKTENNHPNYQQTTKTVHTIVFFSLVIFCMAFKTLAYILLSNSIGYT